MNGIYDQLKIQFGLWTKRNSYCFVIKRKSSVRSHSIKFEKWNPNPLLNIFIFIIKLNGIWPLYNFPIVSERATIPVHGWKTAGKFSIQSCSVTFVAKKCRNSAGNETRLENCNNKSCNKKKCNNCRRLKVRLHWSFLVRDSWLWLENPDCL